VTVVVRPPKTDDAEGLARAARDLAEQYAELEPERFRVPDQSAVIDWYENALQEPPRKNALWLVAEADGEAVGEVQARLHGPIGNADVQPQRDLGQRRAYVNYLAVQAAYQSHGIGGLLMRAVEEWARQSGADLIETDTNLRSRAVEFYEKQGYERRSVILRKRLAP
jgi:ribosomal protein S18 acetylase RimI-like enzyme